MNRREIRERVEEALQDGENRRWTNSELNRYISDAHREFVRLTRYPQSTDTVALSSSSATPILASSSEISGKTISVTTTAAHNLTSQDVVVLYDSSGGLIGAFPISSYTASSFNCFVGEGVDSGSVQTVSYLSYKPFITIPDTIIEAISISLDGKELAVMSEGELNSAAYRNSGGSAFIDGVFGTIQNPFSTVEAKHSVLSTPRWKERNGPVEAAVMNNTSARTFRVFPLPAKDSELFIDPDSSTKYFKNFEIRGVPKVADFSSDSSEPIINHFFHESLVFGALERAYMREGQTRNSEKGMMFRAKFMEAVSESRNSEPMNSFTRSEGRNESYFRVTR